MKKLGILYIALTSVFLFSCNDETMVKSYSPTTFYSFNTPEISFGEDADKGKKFKLNFTFQCDTSKMVLMGLPDRFWAVNGNEMVLDLSKASDEWAGGKLEWQLKFKETADEGDYRLKLAKVEAIMGGEPVDMEFTFTDGSKSTSYSLSNTPFQQKIKLDIPVPLWIIIVSIFGVIALLVFAVYKWLARPNGPIGPVVFDAQNSMINVTASKRLPLKGQENYDLSKEGMLGSKLIPRKRTIKGKKVIAVKLDLDMTSIEKIHLMNGSYEEEMKNSFSLKDMDRVIVTVKGGNEIIFDFRNPKDKRPVF